MRAGVGGKRMLIDDILGGLDETGGNATVVADRLGVAPTYVYRIKREKWIAPANETAVTTAPQNGTPAIVTQEEVLYSLAPNLPAIQNLRDTTIAKLKNMVNDGQISAKALTGLLSTLLKYEHAVNELARPALNLFDQRRQTVNVFGGLVEQLAQMDKEQLRRLAGTAEPLVIQGEQIDGSD